MNTRFLALASCLVLLAACSSMPAWLGGSGKKAEKDKLPGERVLALPEGLGFAPDEALKGTQPAIPTAVENTEWAQHAGMFPAGAGHLAARSSGKDALEIHHSADAGDGNHFSHMLVPQPVIAGGVVYSMDAKGYISARDAADLSNTRWESKGVIDDDKDETLGGGLAVSGNALYATSGRGIIAAFDIANGNAIWRKTLPAPLRSAPLVVGDFVIAVTIDSQTYALSTKTGEVAWEHRGINETAGLMNAVSPIALGDMVIAPYSSGELFALSAADGKERWSETLITQKHTQATSSFSGIGGDPVADGEVVFAASNNGLTAAIHAGRGQRLWQQAFASANTPWLAGDELFILTGDNVLVNIVKYTGKVRWSVQLDSYLDPDTRLKPITWRGPVLMGGNLVVIGSHGKLLLISPTDGTITATKPIPAHIFTAPVVAGGRLYLIDQDATLYSFE